MSLPKEKPDVPVNCDPKSEKIKDHHVPTHAHPTNLQEYERVVTGLANLKSPKEITNAGKDFARIIMKNIFRTSESSIMIFARGLNEGVSEGEYIDELKKYLDKNTYLSVLLETDPTKDGGKSIAVDVIKEYRKKNPHRISLKLIDPQKIEWMKKLDNGKVFHFTIGDYRMYRFETDLEKKEAVASFNDTKKCDTLMAIYGELLENATELN